jgi:capsular polysaccharide biosynthesis protein
VQIIQQFELPVGLNHLRIHEYDEKSYSIKQISQLFRQALIVIGMPSHALSHIVWCSSGTQIIEIGQKTMTTDYYEISSQLKFDYWLTLTTKTHNQIDSVDFRNLMLKVFTHLSS